MQITFSNIKTTVKRHLSTIGKRVSDKEGKNMFSNITVSTAEEPLFDLYIAEAMQNVEAFMRQLVTSYIPSSSSATLVLYNTRSLDDFDARCKEFVENYCVNYTILEYLAMTHPDLAEKYERQAASSMQALMAFVFYKEPPVARLNPTLSITIGDPTNPQVYPAGSTVTPTISVSPADLPLSYVSSDESVATVNASGVITGVGAGRATITVAFAGNTTYNPASASASIRFQSFSPVIG